MNAIRGFVLGLCFLYPFLLNAQGVKKEPLPLGDFENWFTRTIKESSIVGGESCDIYYIAPCGKTSKKGGLGLKTPWSSSKNSKDFI